MKGLVALLCVIAPMAWAAGPDSSVRPVARGDILVAPAVTLAAIRPVARPQPVVANARPEPALLRNPPQGDIQISALATSLSIRPNLRPPEIVQKAMTKRRELRRGSVCGDIDIQGEVVGRVPGRIKGCGVENAVKIKSVLGITLSQSSTLDCPTAKALKTWLQNSAKPAFSRQGGGLKGLRVAAHYACRTRNNQKGARISEHGRGRAIDVSGFILQNGTTVTVLKGWNAKSTSKAMRRVHKGACGPFGTVLGPNSDRFHRDHFHFDTARYRSGPFCR